jgi:hypothetical protein
MERKTIFVAVDGAEFEDEADCRRYERVVPFCRDLTAEQRDAFVKFKIYDESVICNLIHDPARASLAEMFLALADLIREARAAEDAEAPR